MKCPRCQFENPADTNFCGKCGWPLAALAQSPLFQTETLIAPLRELERGSIFAGRYEVIEELGKGGMGRVYKVFDRKIKENVALKLLRPEIAADEKTIERFGNELKFARKISHRNVCRMYDLGQEGTTFFITMEYVPGEDLKSFIKRSGHLTEGKAISIARQIAEGLVEAHHLGVLHRDLKPHNIMIDREGNARIMDFGIARSLHAPGITGTGVLIGTPEYMSPEQAEAEGVDQRSDIYSLGVILYEMVTGRVPFAGETSFSIALKHISATPKDPREFNAHVSEGLSRLILKCLEKARERRFQSAADLQTELSKIEKGIPTEEKAIPEKKPAASREITVKLDLKKVLKPAIILAGILFMALVMWRFLPRQEKISPATLRIPQIKRQERPPSSSESQIPQELGKWIAGLAAKEGQEPKSSKGVSGFFESALREAAKHINQQEYDKARKAMEALKEKIPRDSFLMTLWNGAEAKIREAEKSNEAGNIQESQKSYEEGQNQMAKILALVEEKGQADAARTEMQVEKKKAAEELPAEQENLLFKVASAKEQDAAGAYKRDDFSGAKTLYTVLKKVFELSAQVADQESGLRSLQDYVQELRADADSSKGAELASWHYQEARKEEVRAEGLARKKEYITSAETYIQAAFLYEMAREKASEVSQTK